MRRHPHLKTDKTLLYLGEKVFDFPWGSVALQVPVALTADTFTQLVERNAWKLAHQTKHKKDYRGDILKTGLEELNRPLGWPLNGS